MIDAAAYLTMFLAAAGLIRIFRNQRAEIARLERNEKLARDCMRDAIRSRDALFIEHWKLRREHQDLIAKAYEQELELDIYHAEDEMRGQASALARRAVAN